MVSGVLFPAGTGCHGSGVPQVRNVRENFGGLAILAVRRTLSLTGSMGEYLRVVGIHSDHSIYRDISLVYYQFQNIFRFPNTAERPNAPFRRCAHAHLPPKVSRTFRMRGTPDI